MRARFAALCGAVLIAAWGCGSVEGPLLRRVGGGDSGAGGAGHGDAGDDAQTPSGLIEQDVAWQYQLSGTIDLDVDAQLFVLDLFQLSSARITQLHADGKVVVAYLSAGTVESFRADADDFPSASVGNTHPRYPNEAWLDVRDEGARAVMAQRLSMARDKGFDGVLPTNLSGDLNDTGFDLTAEDLRAYGAWLAEQAHARGLAIGLTDFEHADQLAAIFDWAMHFGCIERGDCDELSTFTDLGKPVFDVEFEGAVADTCAQGAMLGLNVLIKRPALDAYRVSCW